MFEPIRSCGLLPFWQLPAINHPMASSVEGSEPALVVGAELPLVAVWREVAWRLPEAVTQASGSLTCQSAACFHRSLARESIRRHSQPAGRWHLPVVFRLASGKRIQPSVLVLPEPQCSQAEVTPRR